jgi:hypothetical protein
MHIYIYILLRYVVLRGGHRGKVDSGADRSSVVVRSSLRERCPPPRLLLQGGEEVFGKGIPPYKVRVLS